MRLRRLVKLSLASDSSLKEKYLFAQKDSFPEENISESGFRIQLHRRGRIARPKTIRAEIAHKRTKKSP